MIACTRAPYTGRVQSFDEPNPDATSAIDRAAAAYRRSVRPSADAAAVARGEHVSASVIAAAKAGPAAARAQRRDWQVLVIDAPDATIASFPNGALFVSASLVRLQPTDDALAAVVGQAVARVLLRHDAEDAGHRGAEQSVARLGDFAPSPETRRARRDERDAEADWVGMLLAVDAGYDPDRAMTAFDVLGLRARAERVRPRLPELRARAAEVTKTPPPP